MVREGGYGVHDKDFWVERTSRRNFFIIVLSFSGRGRFSMEDGTVFEIGPGQAFVSSTVGQGHREETFGDEPWEHLWMSFSPTSTLFPTPDFDYKVVPFDNVSTMRGLVRSMLSEELYDDHDTPSALENYEHLILIQLSRIFDTSESYEIRNYRSKFAMLWRTVTAKMSKPWSVDDLCKEMNYSRSQLTRICNMIYNESPGQKVKEIKMNHAMLLLSFSLLSVGEIADRIGYTDISTFSSAFTKHFGMSPSEARRKRSAMNVE